jgi:hypothetical protein
MPTRQGLRALGNRRRTGQQAKILRRSGVLAGEAQRPAQQAALALACKVRPSLSRVIQSMATWSGVGRGDSAGRKHETGLGSVVDLVVLLRRLGEVPPELPPADSELVQLIQVRGGFGRGPMRADWLGC